MAIATKHEMTVSKVVIQVEVVEVLEVSEEIKIFVEQKIKIKLVFQWV